MRDRSIRLHAARTQDQDVKLFPVRHLRSAGADQALAKQVEAGPSMLLPYAVSAPDNPIPHADRMLELLTDVSIQHQVDTGSVEQALQDLQKLAAQLAPNSTLPAQLHEAEEGWKAAVTTLGRQIEDLLTVFENVVFPNNRFTRKRGDYRGSSLHLPGLIKAVSTDFNYKKIFSSKTAGGRKQYTVSLVVDVSLSMNGLLAQSAVEALVTIISALIRLNLESFSIVFFGERVRVIKSHEMPWDTAAIYIMLSSLNFDAEFATMDADAIQCALALLDRSGQAGQKKIFVLTDGYGSCGLRFAQVWIHTTGLERHP